MSDHDNWKDEFGQALANAILFVVDDKTMSPDWFDSRNVDAVRDELLRTMPALKTPAGWTFTRGDTGRIVVVSPATGPGFMPVWAEDGSHAEALLFALADAILKEQGK